MPVSCEQCGKTDLWQENLEAWNFFATYQGVIRFIPKAGYEVNYETAFRIMDRLGSKRQLVMIRKLEAIRQGLNGQHG